MLGILKYIRGYLRIRVWGFSPERFMNLCSNKDILLWDIEQENDNYVMCISLKSFYKIRPIVRKTGTRVAIIKRYGLPFLMPVILRRKVFLTGLSLTLCFWYVSSLFVWDIELSGNYRITDDVLESFLEGQGVRAGVRRDRLEIGELEKAIRRAFPEVIWTSARLEGTRLWIYIKENDAPVIGEDDRGQETAGSDLTAEYDGRIVSMIVRSGVPMVQIGDTVEKGTVLVDGKVPVYNEDATVREYIFTDADADICMEHSLDFRTELSFDYIKKEYTGREKKQYFLQLGGRKEIKLPCEVPYMVYDSVMRQSRPGLFDKLNIPVSGGYYLYREYQNVEHEYTLDEAESILREKLSDFLTTLEEKGIQMIEKNVKIDTGGNGWFLQGVFLVQEAVGKRTATDRGEQEANERND